MNYMNIVYNISIENNYMHYIGVWYRCSHFYGHHRMWKHCKAFLTQTVTIGHHGNMVTKTRLKIFVMIFCLKPEQFHRISLPSFSSQDV